MDIMNGLLGFGDKLYQAFLVEDRWRLYLDGLGADFGGDNWRQKLEEMELVL